MKKIVCVLVSLAMIGLLMLMVIRKERVHIRIVKFEYSRTMEFKRAQGQKAMMSLREKSLRSLELLFEDWKYGSTSGEVPLYKRVKRQLLSLSFGGRILPEKQVDEFIRATRFEIDDAQACEMPIKGRIIVNTGAYDVAAELANVYVECLHRYVDEENTNWAMKATMDKGLVVQELESEQAIRKKMLSSPQLTDIEKDRIKRLIADGMTSIDKAKAELEKSRRTYRETFDSTIAFHAINQ